MKLHSDYPENISHSICPSPWSTLLINFDGGISFCCFHPAFANIRSRQQHSLEEVWNGSTAQQLRRKWKEGDLSGTPCAICQGLRMFKMYDYPIKYLNLPMSDISVNLQLNLKEFNTRAITLKSMPVEIYYIPGTSCNIHCIHCFQPAPKDLGREHIDTHDLLTFYNYFGKLGIRNIFAGGEPFHMRQTYDLISQFSPAHKAAAEAFFETNGQLIKDKLDSIKGFGRYGFLISIASFRKEIYESIHKGASFDRLLKNLQFLNSLRDNGLHISIKRIMVLMKSNFDDLEAILHYNQVYGFDETWIMPIHPAYGRFSILPTENIFDLPYLLEDIPHWQQILQQVIEEAEIAENKIIYNHLQYIRGRLSSSIILNRLRSIRNLLVWRLKETLLRIRYVY